MIKLYFSPAPNPMKVALFLEEAGLPYELVPVDTRRGEQHEAAFRAVNPNGKLPAITDPDGPGGQAVRVFDSSAILLYLADKTGQFGAAAPDRAELLSWLMFVATGVGPYSGQAVHFQRAAPEPMPYAINRYRREAGRHYEVLDEALSDGRPFLVGGQYTIVDMSVWGWVDRASFVLPGSEDPLSPYPHLKRLFQSIDARPAVARVREAAARHSFKQDMDEEARRAMFPSNYPAVRRG